MSSTSKNSFARAASPMVTALTHTAPKSVSDEEKAVARQSVVLHADTFDDVIAIIPTDYRQVLTDPLKGAHAATVKLCSARRSLSKLRAHEQQGTFPSHLALKAPVVQMTKEFAESSEGRDAAKEFEERHSAYLKTLLSNALKAKTEEVDFLAKGTSRERLYPELIKVVDARAKEIGSGLRVPIYKPNASDVIVETWKESPIVKIRRDEMRQDVWIYAWRVMQIVESREAAADAKSAAKKAIFEGAQDVHMDVDSGSTSVPTAGPSLATQMEKEIARQLRPIRESLKATTRGVKDGKKIVAKSNQNPPARVVKTPRKDDSKKGKGKVNDGGVKKNKFNKDKKGSSSATRK